MKRKLTKQVVAHGSLRAMYDGNGKIDVLDMQTNEHSEYVPRQKLGVQAVSPEQKQSPKVSKNMAKRAQQRQAQQPQPQLGLIVPESIINDAGTTNSVSMFLEVRLSSSINDLDAH